VEELRQTLLLLHDCPKNLYFFLGKINVLFIPILCILMNYHRGRSQATFTRRGGYLGSPKISAFIR
jgi:hypothetical protein